MTLRIETILGPAWFASAAINGDYSGLTSEEYLEFVAWRNFNVWPGFDFASCGEESHFSWECRAHGLPWTGGELIEYILISES